MRARRAAVAAVVGLVAVVTAGCGSGDAGSTTVRLVPLSARPPQLGNCYVDDSDVAYLATNKPMDCASTHKTETVGVGTFTGQAAQVPRAPVLRSAPLREAFADCDKQAQAYVGGDWRGATLSLQVVVPEPQMWDAGARWFRCDLFELVAVDGTTTRNRWLDYMKERDGSLRGVVKAGKPPAYSCFTGDKWDQLWPAGCAKKHRFEYVGIWTAPNLAWKDLDAQDKRVFRECRRLISVFVGRPKTSPIGEVFGVTYRLPSPEAWDRGDRGVRCFLWSDKKDLTRSLRGTLAGPS